MLHSLLDSAHCSEHGGLQGKALSIWKCNANSEPSNCFHTSAEGKIWYLFLVSFDNFFTSLLHFLILHLFLNTYNIYPGIIICSYIFHVFYIYLQKYHNINILRSFINMTPEAMGDSLAWCLGLIDLPGKLQPAARLTPKRHRFGWELDKLFW